MSLTNKGISLEMTYSLSLHNDYSAIRTHVSDVSGVEDTYEEQRYMIG